jgi:hypothetical protein
MHRTPEFPIWEIEIRGSETYFAFLALSARILAHRAFVARESLARTAADIVLLAVAPFGLLVCPGVRAAVLPPFRAGNCPRSS